MELATTGGSRSIKQSDKILAGSLMATIVAIIGYVLYNVLPYLIELAENTIIFGVEILVLIAAIVYLKDAWFGLYYGLQIMARNTRKAIAGYDPIATLAVVEKRYGEKLEEIDSNIALADGAKKRQENAIAASLRDRDKELAIAVQAKKENKELPMQQHAMAAERWEKSAEEMKPMLETLANALNCMQRARDLCAVKLEDIKNQKVVLSRKLEALLAGRKAVRNIKRFLGANPDLEMQELAVEEIERQSTESLAEIDQFMRQITPSLEGGALAQDAEQSAAVEHFSKYLEGAEKRILLPPPQPVQTIPTAVPEREKAVVINSRLKGDTK